MARTRCWPHVCSRRLLALVVLLPLLAGAVEAVPLTAIPNPRLREGNRVTDMPGVLRPDTVAQLNAMIGDLERTTGVEMAVVVIPSLDGLSIDEAAVELFDLWGIGKKTSDNGVLVLWSTGDRRIRVEVGYGLEGTLPDGKVGSILDTHVMPSFRSDRFDEGLLAGVEALINAARGEPVALLSQRTASYERPSPGVTSVIVGLLSGIPLSIGSFLGFRKWRRYHRRRCPACQTWMKRLDESNDDALLAGGQQAEERIRSVNYDVWKCGNCGHHFTLRYPRWMTTYAACPQCHNRTKSSTETVHSAATTTATGSARVIETCAFCTFRREYMTVLPMVEAGGASSGGRSGGGSSFGGGRSGGGGASRGY